MADRKKTGENQEMNMAPRKHAWQEWELTAFVLDELDAASATRIEAAAAEDARLSAEIVAIRKTVGRVSDFFQSEQPQPMVDSQVRFEQIVAQASRKPEIVAEVAETFGSATPQIETLYEFRDVRNGLAGAKSPALEESNKLSPRTRPLAWLGLLAMSASLLLAAWLSAPAISTWMLASSTPSELGPDVDSSKSAPANHEVPDELTAQLEMEQLPGPASGRSSRLSEQARESKESSGLETGADPVAMVLDDTSSMTTSSPDDGDLPPFEILAESSGRAMPTAASSSLSAATVVENEAKVLLENLAQNESEAQVQQLSRARGGASDYGAMGMGTGGAPGVSMGGGLGGYDGMPGDAGLGGYGGARDGFGRADGSDSGYGLGGMGMGMGGGYEANGRSEVLSSKKYGRGEEEAERRRAKLLGLTDASSDRFAAIYENPFTAVEQAPLSTFSIDVDTASYTKSRQLLLEAGRLPPAGAVRLEEFINYFDYEYAGPQGEDPFGSQLAVASCPWRPEHRLVRIALQATKVDVAQRPNANIVFLLDVSGSMGEPNKLPLVKESMRMLVQQLGENDKVAMVVYAGAAGCVLEGTRGNHQQKILQALENLNAGGSTNGGQGIQLAYDLARDNFVPEGVNRVILCTDGDFNVGVTSTESLVDLAAENAKSKIFLTVLGFGMGNTNDAMMEEISNRGNGVYGFVDSRREAHRQMVRQLAGNLMTVAKDVKIQVEFNPNKVQAYRLLGYENRMLATEDFDNDKKDAGEIGAGHRVTALYEIVPVDSAAGDKPAGSELRYQKPVVSSQPIEPAVDSEFSDELLAVKMRYKQPEGDVSKLLTFPLKDGSVKFSEADRDFRWAASMAEFGMLLRDSKHLGNANWSGLIEQAISAAGVNPSSERQECLEMMRTAARLSVR